MTRDSSYRIGDSLFAENERSAAIAIVVLLFCACLAGIPEPCAAQSGRGVITGIVKDPSGAIVPGADITITEIASGVATHATTTEAGVYRAPYMPPGTYKITASLAGFKTGIADHIQVLLGQTVTVDFTLEVGQVAEQVTVTAAAPLLETSSSEIGVNAVEKEVHTWPIIVGDGTRQLQSFVFRMMPGTEGGEFAGSINGGQSYSHEILIDGITIGRMDLNGGSNNEFTPTMDAVSEFKLQTGALSSQYGNTQTALVNFGMKSGTNEYHGGMFWLHRDRSLNANSWTNNYFGNPKSPFLDNNGGATFGGPVWIPGLYKGKDRTHFYFSYELERFKNDTKSGFQSLPIAAFRKGDFSRLLDPNFTRNSASGTQVGTDALGRPVVFGQIYDPSTARQVGSTWVRDPYPGNIIPSNKFSRVTQNALKEDIPLPLLDLFRNNNPKTSGCCPVLEIDNLSIKLDHVVNTKHKLAGTFVKNDRGRKRFGNNSTPAITPIPGPAMAAHKFQDTPGYITRVSEDWTVTPRMLNHFAYGYNRFNNRNQAFSFLSGEDWASKLGMQGVPSRGFPQFNFSGFSTTLTGGYPQLGIDATGDAPRGSGVVQNDFTWLHGNHSFRMGVEHRRYYSNGRSTSTTGSYTFHNENTSLPGFSSSTGFAYASFLLGTAFSANVPIRNLTPGVRSRTWALYLQDDWKMRRNLTLNIGLRWDIPSPLTEVRQRMSGLDPTKPNTGADGFPGALVFLGNCNGCNGEDAFTTTYYKQFGPRIGFAWTPADQKGNIVVRGGYGINFTPPILDGFQFPYHTGFNGSNPIPARSRGRFREDASYSMDTPYPPYTATLPNLDPTQLNGQTIGYYRPETNRLPYVQNWNLGVQLALPWETKLELNYVGNKGTRLNEVQYINSLNQVDPKWLSLGDALLDPISAHPEIKKPYASFSSTVARALRPFPQYEGINTHRLNNGWSTYHALQITAIHRTSHGLSFLAAYTFSKALGTADTSGPGNYYDYGQNFYNRRSDYSVTAYNIPSDLKLTWIYDLPFGPNGRWMRSGVTSRILGGWTMSMLHRYRSGDPISIGAGGFEGQALFNGGLRADILLPRDQQVLGVPGGSIDVLNGMPYLNPKAFANPPLTKSNVPIHLGNASRFLPNLRGFAIYTEDFSLIKRTDLRFREGASFEIRMDAINVFNRTVLFNPNTNTTDPSSFGRIFGKGNTGGPRNIQLGARINF